VVLAQKKPAPRKTRTRLEVDERKSQLLALGLRIFSERSYDEVSVDDLAQAAGISKGLLYHYFPTKRVFYIAALEQAASDLLVRTDTTATTPEERVMLGLETYLDFVEQHGGAYLALIRGGLGTDPEVYGILERTRATFVDRIAAELPGPASPLLRTLLRGWLGFVEATSTEWLVRRDVTRAELVPTLAMVLGPCVAMGEAAPPRAPRAVKKMRAGVSR
jgi:AcrR family transcriptional regulator